MELWLVLLSAGVCLGPYVVRGRRVSLILSRVRRLLLFGCRLMALFVGRLLYTFPSVMAHNYRCLFTGTRSENRSRAFVTRQVPSNLCRFHHECQRASGHHRSPRSRGHKLLYAIAS